MSKNAFHRAEAAIFLIIFCAGILILVNPRVQGESSGLTEPADTEKTTTLSERLKKRKEDLKLSISDKTRERLSAKCQPAQKVIGKLKTRDSSSRDKHHRAYTKMVERLETMIARLGQQGLSTAALQNTQQRLVDAVNQYRIDAETYRAAINDLASMACVTELEGFQATLVTARTQREQLSKDAAAIRAAVSEARTALADTKKILQNTESVGGGN